MLLDLFCNLFYVGCMIDLFWDLFNIREFIVFIIAAYLLIIIEKIFKKLDGAAH